MDPSGARDNRGAGAGTQGVEEGCFLESCVLRGGSLGGWEEGLRKPRAWGSLTVNIEPLINALDWLKDPDKGHGSVTFPKVTCREGWKAKPSQCSLGVGGFE